MENHDAEISRMMEYLPAVYRGLDDTELKPSDETYSGQPPFLNYFLLAFEEVLLGRKKRVPKGHAKSDPSAETGSSFESLEDEITDLHRLFEPEHTPARFLAWLAGWAALSLEASLSLEKRRKLVASIIPLYRIRGTKAYVEQLLKLHLEARSAVDDEERPQLQVGLSSTIAKDTYLGGGPPHCFRVTLSFETKDPVHVNTQAQIARSVIDLAKPGHTFYQLDVVTPRMQVGVHSTVGVDTTLGDRPLARARKETDRVRQAP